MLPVTIEIVEPAAVARTARAPLALTARSEHKPSPIDAPTARVSLTAPPWQAAGRRLGGGSKLACREPAETEARLAHEE